MFLTDFGPVLGVLFAVVWLASFLGTGAIIQALQRRDILDHPNERSSHSSPTPRGAGIAVVPVVIAAWLAFGLAAAEGPGAMAAVTIAALGLGLLSWKDDLGGVAVTVRLLAQGGAVALVFLAAPPGAVFQGLLPPVIDGLAAALMWLWFINLFNFMDGIDGMAGTETLFIGAGVAVVVFVAGLDEALGFYGLTLAAAALGFLWWNWQPARIFLGDVGSVPLGFLIGWLLLRLAAEGQWAAALILPSYYLADSAWTLAARGLAKKPVWKAHREHFYQRAVQQGASHGAVVAAIAAANVVLVGLAAAAAQDRTAPGRTALMLGGAVITVALLLRYLSAGRGSQDDKR